MAIVSSNYPDLPSMDSALASIETSSISFYLQMSEWAYYNSFSYDFVNPAISWSNISGYLSNGDYLSIYGSNLTGFPFTVTSAYYSSQPYGIDISFFGSVVIASDDADPTGYLNRVVVSDGSAQISYDGNVDVTSGNVSFDHIVVQSGAVSLTIDGSLYEDYMGIGGVITGLTLASGAFSANITGIGIDYDLLYSINSASELAALVMSGNDTVTGSDGSEYLFGLGGADSILAWGGNDTLDGGPGDDTLNGGLGIDTALFGADRASYGLTKTATGHTVAGGTDGADTLTDIERLQFADSKLALDLLPSQNAGLALEFIGVLDYPSIGSPAIVGTILSFFDAGYSMPALCQLADDIGLFTQLAGSDSNADLARLAYRNVVGAEADENMVDFLVGFMDGRIMSLSQADFIATVAGLELNQIHIDLVGYQQTGVEFV